MSQPPPSQERPDSRSNQDGCARARRRSASPRSATAAKPMPPSADVARKRYAGDGVAKQTKELQGGGYFLVVETDFKGTKIRELFAVVKDKAGTGHVTCSAEVQSDSDVDTYGAACQSLRLAE